MNCQTRMSPCAYQSEKSYLFLLYVQLGAAEHQIAPDFFRLSVDKTRDNFSMFNLHLCLLSLITGKSRRKVKSAWELKLHMNLTELKKADLGLGSGIVIVVMLCLNPRPRYTPPPPQSPSTSFLTSFPRALGKIEMTSFYQWRRKRGRGGGRPRSTLCRGAGISVGEGTYLLGNP